jgi:hypothetical protein
MPGSNPTQHEVLSKTTTEAIEDGGSPELKLLLRILQSEISEDDIESQATFAKMIECISQHPDFEKIFDDIPDSIKKIIEAYALSRQKTNKPEKMESGFFGLEQLASWFNPQTKRHSDIPRSASMSQLPLSPHFHRLAAFIIENLKPFPLVLEGDGKPMERIQPGTTFENWGRTVENTPSDTFVARTEVGLCNLVKWAASVKKKVRVAGYRHTVSDF